MLWVECCVEFFCLAAPFRLSKLESEGVLFDACMHVCCPHRHIACTESIVHVFKLPGHMGAPGQTMFLRDDSCRDGLRDLFYGVYQKDVDKCLDSLGQMGVLVGGDRTAIKRTAEFFLKQFDQRLAEQRAEREANPDSQKEFKPQRSKEESKAKRKAVRLYTVFLQNSAQAARPATHALALQTLKARVPFGQLILLPRLPRSCRSWPTSGKTFCWPPQTSRSGSLPSSRLL